MINKVRQEPNVADMKMYLMCLARCAKMVGKFGVKQCVTLNYGDRTAQSQGTLSRETSCQDKRTPDHLKC